MHATHTEQLLATLEAAIIESTLPADDHYDYFAA